jgi:hypothetical protein
VPDPRSYTPRHLAEKILRDRAALEGERRTVTVLFADAVGFTPISERLDEEQVYDLMQGCLARMMEAVHRYEGTITQFTGDGVGDGAGKGVGDGAGKGVGEGVGEGAGERAGDGVGEGIAGGGVTVSCGGGSAPIFTISMCKTSIGTAATATTTDSVTSRVGRARIGCSPSPRRPSELLMMWLHHYTRQTSPPELARAGRHARRLINLHWIGPASTGGLARIVSAFIERRAVCTQSHTTCTEPLSPTAMSPCPKPADWSGQVAALAQRRWEPSSRPAEVSPHPRSPR